MILLLLFANCSAGVDSIVSADGGAEALLEGFWLGSGVVFFSVGLGPKGLTGTGPLVEGFGGATGAFSLTFSAETF